MAAGRSTSSGAERELREQRPCVGRRRALRAREVVEQHAGEEAARLGQLAEDGRRADAARRPAASGRSPDERPDQRRLAGAVRADDGERGRRSAARGRPGRGGSRRARPLRRRARRSRPPAAARRTESWSRQGDHGLSTSSSRSSWCFAWAPSRAARSSRGGRSRPSAARACARRRARAPAAAGRRAGVVRSRSLEVVARTRASCWARARSRAAS